MEEQGWRSRDEGAGMEEQGGGAGMEEQGWRSGDGGAGIEEQG
jgi:hypothetical protein